jgi:Meiotically up-regulated gene 113
MNKTHILAEIKRTAESNGGRPLGRERFVKETGIKTGVWNRYWVRWSEALREAGYAPNRLTSAYSENDLLEPLVALARELGRFPVYGEIRFKARQDASFPSHSVFQGRFRSKLNLVEAVRRYCETRPGYGDVVAICEEAKRGRLRTVDDDADDNDEDEDSFGFVYLSKSGRYYKIGRSNSAGRREYEVALQMPEKYVTIHAIRTDDPVGIEAYWHKRFEDRRKNGEWFDLSSQDVKTFKRRKFM